MVNISVYPYGNANERQGSNGEWTFTCQHGESECDGNMVETCFINLVKFDQNQFMNFIIAYETAISHNTVYSMYQLAQQVLQKGSYNVTWTALSECIGKSGAQGGKTGNAFEHQMAIWTQQVNNQYSPWITLNGKHSKSIQNECQSSTLECTCNVYTGTNSCCNKFAEEPRDDVDWKDRYI